MFTFASKAGSSAVAPTALVNTGEGAELLQGPENIPQEARRQLLLVQGSKVKPYYLEVSKSYLYKMRTGLKPIPDSILEMLAELASDDDLARVPFFAPYVDYRRIRELGSRMSTGSPDW